LGRRAKRLPLRREAKAATRAATRTPPTDAPTMTPMLAPSEYCPRGAWGGGKSGGCEGGGEGVGGEGGGGKGGGRRGGGLGGDGGEGGGGEGGGGEGAGTMTVAVEGGNGVWVTATPRKLPLWAEVAMAALTPVAACCATASEGVRMEAVTWTEPVCSLRASARALIRRERPADVELTPLDGTKRGARGSGTASWSVMSASARRRLPLLLMVSVMSAAVTPLPAAAASCAV